MRDSKTIISEIKDLLDELSLSIGVKPEKKQSASSVGKSAIPPKGALGAINILIEEKFFDSPKEISSVIERLKEIGHYHKSTAVAMNLLNLTKRRVLNRFKNRDTKNWEYVIRK